MFIKSAASDTRQGKAIQAVNERWGESTRRWTGRETIGIPVCKKKYAPFKFEVVRGKNGEASITIERMFGCRIHSDLRKATIEKYGCREGWEPFGQWSIKKAQELAKRQTDRLNQGANQNGSGNTNSNGTIESGASSSSSDETLSSSEEDEKTANGICVNGSCAWRSRNKYDNVKKEITGIDSDDDAFDYR